MSEYSDSKVSVVITIYEERGSEMLEVQKKGVLGRAIMLKRILEIRYGE